MSNDDPTIDQMCNMSDKEFEHRHGYSRDKANPGAELPVTVERNLRTDPVEGEQGTIHKIVEHDCPACGYDRCDLTVLTLPAQHILTCRACEYNVETA